ncbi:hypothetical protein ADICYQ_1584 [Cyclobacterium qasimii M12-11B]|uniref:Uncharacterized protein n=1 Tax=Cyclobacterium qasimii M12-11B TaxID=641524 RepID=S7WRH5_9BACT|nr:hypothetical protein ADICYQ_1584 [Cyclobacterium qasimii M12-11B]
MVKYYCINRVVDIQKRCLLADFDTISPAFLQEKSNNTAKIK